MTSISVLFIDDSDLDVMLSVRVLRAAGCDVRYDRVERAEDLRQRLGDPWDVVVCDHQMPEFDALSALRLFHESGSDAPFLIVSGAIPDDLAIAAMRQGARDFIHKNNLVRLAPAIDRELREARNRQLLRDTQASVEQLLNHDLLTGLANLNGLMLDLGQRITTGRPFALLLADFNGFGRVAQTLGSVGANRALRISALRLDSLRTNDQFAARVGQDRFALVCTGVDHKGAVERMVEMVKTALQEPIAMDGHDLTLTSAIGVSLFPEHGYRTDLLLRCAETAVAFAKRAGLGCWRLYENDMGEINRSRQGLERALRRAITEGEFALHYQPQFALDNARPVGVEALLRWHSPEHGIQLPGDFLPALVDSGLIVPVSDWVLDEALAQYRRWIEQGVTVGRVAINVAALQFQRPDFVESFAAALNRHHVPANAVELEITERLAMGDEERTIASLQRLREMGVRLSIDDFGTGYCSLGYLRHFPVDCLKIDRSFMPSESNGGDAGVIRAVLGVAQSLGLETLAEGVESAALGEELRAAGCGLVQGFHYAKPLDAGQCAEFLRRYS